MSKQSESKNINGTGEYKIFETNTFQQNLENYPHLKPTVENKLRFLRSDSYCGEPLKYELAGYRTINVKRNFLILYGICTECKKVRALKKGFTCEGYGDRSVVVYALGPHDDLYKIALKTIDANKKRQ